MIKLFKRLRRILSDEQKRTKEMQFNELVVLIENNLGRAVGGHELRVLFSMDVDQMEVITRWMKEVSA